MSRIMQNQIHFTCLKIHHNSIIKFFFLQIIIYSPKYRIFRLESFSVNQPNWFPHLGSIAMWNSCCKDWSTLIMRLFGVYHRAETINECQNSTQSTNLYFQLKINRIFSSTHIELFISYNVNNIFDKIF